MNLWINEPLQSSSESDDDNQSDDHSNFFNLGSFDKTEENEIIPNTAEQVEKVIINYIVNILLKTNLFYIFIEK